MPDGREKTIPLHEDRLAVDKRAIETGRVRVAVRVHEHDEIVEQVLQSRAVEIKRVTVNQPVEVRPETRQEGETLIIPLVEEEIVVSKRLMLREEIHIRSKTTERTERIPVTRRTEQAEITRSDAPEDKSKL